MAWATASRSGMTEVPLLPDTALVFERGWLSSNNVLLFDDEERATLVDTGYVTQRDMTAALVEQALGGRQLVRILNTHLHSDHCGGNAHLQRVFGAKIFIPPGHADEVRRWDEDALSYRATGQQCERFSFDGLIVPGATLTMGDIEWQALAAPGHDPYSLVFWAPEPRILISADALWSHGFGVIFPELEGESGFAEQRGMLELIASLEPKLVIPGHGPTFSNVQDALRVANSRLDALSASPQRNARHAARVLVKFHLLAARRTSLQALSEHLHTARYFRLINQKYFGLTWDAFVNQQVNDLVAAGAAALDGDFLVNVDR